MFNKLRNRLIVSHLIPYLLLIPIMGFIFIYLVETQVILAGVASELTGQGILVVELAQNAPEIWTDPTAAQAFNQKLAAKVDARLMLLTPQGTLLSSSDPADTTRIGQILPIEKKASLSVGQIYANVDHSQQLQTEVVDVLLPVIDANGSMIGIIRLSQRLSDVYQRFSQLRVTIVGILAGGLLLTIVFSIALSINVERPLRRLTESVQKIIAGKRDSLLVEQGPQEVRILQHSFNQLSSLLNEQEQLRRRLIANLVHELGRSLGALRAAIQALLRNGIKNPELAQDLVAGMDEETKQLRRLLDDLANLQDVLAGSLRLEMQPLQLSEWLPVVLRPWEVMAHEKGLTWSENIPKNLPTINADSTRLDQALGNLLSNAVKFTPRGGKIRIRVEKDERFLVIHFKDNGLGIPPEEHEQIFTPFYQSNQGKTPVAPGMGLGLSIARELIINQDGHIQVESTPGQGSQFSIWLPVVQNS